MAKAKPLPDSGPDSVDADPVIPTEPDRITADPDAGETTIPQPTPIPQIDPAPAKSTLPRKGSGIFGPLIGGVIAAGIGFGLATYVLPNGWQGANDQSAAIAAQIAALQSELAAVKAAVSPPDARIENLGGEVAALRAALAALPPLDDTSVADLEQRIETIESLPMGQGGLSPAALGAMQADIAALKGQVAMQTGNDADLIATVEAAAKAAEERLAQASAEAQELQAQAQVTSALGRVQAALETGAPFAAALADLSAAGVMVPDMLTVPAETGVASLPALQASFGDAARAALEASLAANPGTGFAERVGTFLQSQTGARSLTPQTGDDPDAILSRAEAALQSGDLAAALAELGTLPAEGQVAMTDWATLAVARIAATDALAGLMDSQP